MNIFTLLIIYFNFILFTLSSTPSCNFDEIVVDLLSSSSRYEYTIYEKNNYGINVILKKMITKTGNSISSQNYLTVDSVTKLVDFENIHSYYPNQLNTSLIICPKGKFHPYDFDSGNFIIHSDFESSDNWDLRCFLHDTGYFFVLYGYGEKENFFSSYNNNALTKINLYKAYLYDFIYENGNNNDNGEYKIATVHTYYNQITIIYSIFYLKSDYEGRNNLKRQNIINAGIYSGAIFDENNYLYFFTYNSISDFTSGYSTSGLIITDISNTYSLPINTNNTSPFYFLSNQPEIEQINFIPKTKYVYYLINDNGNNYFGIIDIRLNKVLFNIQKEISSIIPCSNNELLILNINSAYTLSSIQDVDICIDSGSNSTNSTIILEENNNENKVKLMPDGIYIDKYSCDLNIYVLSEDGNQCGPCNYFNSDKKYKLVDSNECIDNIPENAEFYDQSLNVLKCKQNYYLNNNLCIFAGCYETCETCSILSSNKDEQKCSSCKAGYILNNGNCIIVNEATEKVTEKLTDIICPEDNTCINYEINSCHCKNCIDGYFLDNSECFKCNELCQAYDENSCKCKNEYSFFGYYNEIKNEKVFILKTVNLTNVEDEILNIIRYKINTSEINDSYVNKGNYFFVETNKAKFILASLEYNNNIETTIDLGECKEKIINNESNSLYILYILVSEEGIHFPKIEYEVFTKSQLKNFEKINLEICKDIPVTKSVSINMTKDEIDKYNSSSGYYNDICYTSSSGNGTDISLTDRRNEYTTNFAICGDNCEFVDYDENNGKALCSCSISTSVSLVSDVKFDKEKLKSNFINFKNIANLNVLKCYKLLFSNKILKNYGCIIISLIMLLEFISIFVFYCYEFNLLKNKIKDIIQAKELDNKYISDKNDPKKVNKKNNRNSNEIKIFGNNGKKKMKRKSSKINKNKIIEAPPKSKSIINKNSYYNIVNKNNTIGKKNSGVIRKSYKKSSKSFSFIPLNNNVINEKNSEKYNNIMKHTDSELNLLPYNEALQNDKRTYCQYNLSLIKTRHLLVFSFCNSEDYNSRIVKINLFFSTFAVNLTINALFFNDSTMHKIYEDNGKFNFIYQIPQILYSTIISSVLIILVKMTALSEKNIIKIKNAKNEELVKIKQSELKSINCKFVFFFIIIIIFTCFFWFYVGCFCSVYKNTQIHLINDTLISFVISLLYPLVIYLIPGIFRIPALNNKEKKEEFLYNISKIIQLFV